MQRPSTEQVDISSDDSSISDGDDNPTPTQPKDEALPELTEEGIEIQPKDEALPELSEEEWLLRRAKSYQEYMHVIPIPVVRDNVIPYKSWERLAWSMKQIYKQPLHYLTHRQLAKWDRERHGAKNQWIQLSILIHPVKAETTIWLMEEVHRLTTSPAALAEYWKDDHNYHRYIDDIHPKLDQ